MPYLSIDVDIDEILSGLSSRELQKLADELYDDGYVPIQVTSNPTYTPQTLQDEEWVEVIGKLSEGRLFLSVDEEEYIKQIAKKL
jgi:hypothetical protein